MTTYGSQRLDSHQQRLWTETHSSSHRLFGPMKSPPRRLLCIRHAQLRSEQAPQCRLRLAQERGPAARPHRFLLRHPPALGPELLLDECAGRNHRTSCQEHWNGPCEPPSVDSCFDYEPCHDEKVKPIRKNQPGVKIESGSRQGM